MVALLSFTLYKQNQFQIILMKKHAPNSLPNCKNQDAFDHSSVHMMATMIRTNSPTWNTDRENRVQLDWFLEMENKW